MSSVLGSHLILRHDDACQCICQRDEIPERHSSVCVRSGAGTDGLADSLHGLASKDLLVMHDVSDELLARHVLVGEETDHSGHLSGFAQRRDREGLR